VATVRRRAATISRMHMAAGLPNPCAHELVRFALKGIAKSVGTDQRQAAGLTDRDTVTICAHMGDSARDLRDVALMLVGCDPLARASELVAISFEDLEQAAAGGHDGALVRVHRRMTSTETHRWFIGPEAQQALQAWIAKAGITRGPVFCSVSKGGARRALRCARATCSGASRPWLCAAGYQTPPPSADTACALAWRRTWWPLTSTWPA
jgi:hypothetical protein